MIKLSNYTIAAKCSDVSDIDKGLQEIRSILDSVSNPPAYVRMRYAKLFSKKEKLTRFHYRDNWHGTLRHFKSISAAIDAAKHETGEFVVLYDRLNKDFSKTLKCSGYTPA